MSEEEVYKAKLAEKRRQAREKAEREAEEKRLADVEARYKKKCCLNCSCVAG